MSYEDSPATKMLAVHCCCCGTALLDAVSVEAGIGPDCRKKHGYRAAQSAPNWETFLALTDGLVAVADIVHPGETEPQRQRRLANLIVHRIAVALDRSPEEALFFTDALRALGFTKLADIIVQRRAKIRIEETGNGDLRVTAPYSERATSLFRSVPGRRWDATAKENVFPSSSKRALWAALANAFPGEPAIGPKGPFCLPQTTRRAA